MRSALSLAVVLSAACGRVSFDLHDVDAAIDASPDATRVVDCTRDPDGTECDDRNICTAASSCSSGSCVATVPIASCTVADSQADFDPGVQGTGGWWYGFWEAEGDTVYDPASDFELGVYGTSAWVPVSPGPFIYVARWGAHPTGNPLRIPVRRWISDVHGPAVAVVDVAKGDTSCGDGIEAQVVVEGSIVWSRSIAFDDPIGVVEPVPIEVSSGTLVDFLVLPKTDDICDTTEYTILIQSP